MIVAVVGSASHTARALPVVKGAEAACPVGFLQSINMMIAVVGFAAHAAALPPARALPVLRGAEAACCSVHNGRHASTR